jgi:hypothetical protein
VLVRDVQTSARKYYVSNNDQNNTHNNQTARKSKIRSQNNTVVVTAGRSRAAQKHDDWSDKSILQESPSQGKIVQTNEIAVEYQDRKDGESVEYEMDHIPNV